MPASPDLYARVAAAIPRAWLEDPAVTVDTQAVLDAHRDRITWDAPIRGAADVAALPATPRAINIKPARIGTLRDLTELIEHCAAARITMYGGGMFEIGPGRGHIQYLASLFYPDAPNDAAPCAYHRRTLPAEAPRSPLVPRPAPRGFTWAQP